MSLLAFSDLRLEVKAGAGNRTATPALSGAPLSRAALRLTACVPRLGRQARARARGQSAGGNYRGPRHEGASPHKWGCAKERANFAARPPARGAGRSGRRGRVGSGDPPERPHADRQRSKFSPFEHHRGRRGPICGIVGGPRLPFQAKRLSAAAIRRRILSDFRPSIVSRALASPRQRTTDKRRLLRAGRSIAVTLHSLSRLCDRRLPPRRSRSLTQARIARLGQSPRF